MLAGYIRFMEFYFIISINRHFKTPPKFNNDMKRTFLFKKYDSIQFMFSFEVNIMICQHENSDVH